MATAFMIGILLALRLPLTDWIWAAAALAAAIFLLILAWRSKTRGHDGDPLKRTMLAALMALLAGGAVMSNWLNDGPDNIAHLPDAQQQRIVRIEGVLLESPRTLRPPDNPLLLPVGHDESTSLLVEVRGVVLSDGRHPASGRVRLIVNEPMPPQLDQRPRTGDRLSATVLLGHFGRALNPGQADMLQVNRLAGVSAAASTRQWQNVTWHRPPWWSTYGWMGEIRHRWQIALKPAEPSAAALLPALVLGDRNVLSDADQQLFAQSGVMHYLAVSGLHVALAALMLIVILRRFMAGPRLRALMVITFVICYALATEMRPSVMRAGIFLILLSLAWLSGRRTNLLNILAAAAIVVLAIRPTDLIQPGFQLSFVVVLGLIIGASRMRERLFGRHKHQKYADATALRRAAWAVRRWLEEIIAVSVTAWLFSAPLLAHHFGQVAPVGIPATIVVFPLAMLLLAMGLLSVALGLIAASLGQAVVYLAHWPAEMMLTIVKWLANLPASHLHLPPFHWPWVMLCLMLLVTWAFRQKLRLGRVRLALACLLAAISFLLIGLPRGPGEDIRITVLAVGNGDTIIVQGPGGYNLLVDCGSSLFTQRTADSIILPALRHLGVTKLDAVLLTHADADHVKDLPPVLGRIAVGRVYVGEHFRADKKSYGHRLLAFLQQQGLAVQELTAGDMLPVPDGMTIRVLGPPKDLPHAADSNHSSLVLLVARSGGGSMMLCGDAPGVVLEQLAATGGPGAGGGVCGCDVILLPHHGERSPATAQAVSALGAAHAVISAARQRDQGRGDIHPWPADMQIYRTWQHGAVTIHLTGRGATIAPLVDTPVR